MCSNAMRASASGFGHQIPSDVAYSVSVFTFGSIQPIEPQGLVLASLNASWTTLNGHGGI